MYDYLDESVNNVKVIGSFSHDKNEDFKASVKDLLEGFQSSYQVDALTDITKILRLDSLKENYKEKLLGDVMESRVDDEYYGTMPEKLEQLFENTSLEMIRESGVSALAPIVGISLPVLKKSYIEGHSKDIVMTEVPTKPILKVAFERRFLKDDVGNKYYIPDVFYDDTYKTIMNKGKGTEINITLPESGETMPIFEYDIINKVTGNTYEQHMGKRQALALDFHVKGVVLSPDNGTTEYSVNGLHIAPKLDANCSFTAEVKTKDNTGTEIKDILMGQVDYNTGIVSVTCVAGKITKVQFGGHLSNENNDNSVELDRERELMEWKIPDGHRINTGLTIEKIKDYKALFDIDITAELISDISTVLSQTEDSEILGFLDDSYENWKTRASLPFGYDLGFTAEGWFNCEPPANKFVTRSQWIDTELKFDLNRFIDELKIKLRNQDLMFVVYGHPNNITLIQDNVRWVIDEDTKIGGIQLDYRFGVMTANQNRIHVISTMKCPKAKGLRVVAYPLSKEIITFKHYKYSLNIENAYRNPFTPLTPNVMGTSRYLTTEVLPVQGAFHILDNEFALKNPNSGNTAATTKVADPTLRELDSDKVANFDCATAGVTFYYTTDGTDPVIGTSATGSSVTLNANATVKVIAVKEGCLPSGVVSKAYTVE